MVYKTAHFKLRDPLKIRVKKGTLLDRVKEIVSETNDAAVDLIKMVQDAIGGLPTNIEIGMDNTALTVEHVRGKKLAIYPTKKSERIGIFIHRGDEKAYFDHMFGKDSVTFIDKRGYEFEIYNKRKYIDDLHSIRVE